MSRKNIENELPVNIEKHVARPGTWRYWFRIALPPFFLCVVAFYQIGRAHWANQTQWKGGGFGMFSTVDSLQARRLRAYIVTQGGDLPIGIPARLRTRANELRAAPSQRKIERLTEKLAQAKWLARDLKQNLPSNVDSQWLHSGSQQYAPVQVGEDSDLDSESGLDDAVEYSPSHGNRSVLRSSMATRYPVRVELWRLEFNQELLRMRATKWFECQRDPEIDSTEEGQAATKMKDGASFQSRGEHRSGDSS